MALSVELVVTPTAKIADNLLKNINKAVDEYFAKTKILLEIGGCSNYMLDKRLRSVYLIELTWFNILLNCRIYKKRGQQYNFFPFMFYFFASILDQC